VNVSCLSGSSDVIAPYYCLTQVSRGLSTPPKQFTELRRTDRVLSMLPCSPVSMGCYRCTFFLFSFFLVMFNSSPFTEAPQSTPRKDHSHVVRSALITLYHYLLSSLLSVHRQFSHVYNVVDQARAVSTFFVQRLDLSHISLTCPRRFCGTRHLFHIDFCSGTSTVYFICSLFSLLFLLYSILNLLLLFPLSNHVYTRS